ncbi:S24 family peptidase [uncultured Maritimibacter sp.]|uniref:LexA family transcriptional regulator n=1 Tax=uncultured Maritimibacter sp. TaxID=991866 RepID=UPI0030DA361E
MSAGYETAADAARAMNIAAPTYSSHENGSRGFPANVAERYAKFFKVDPAWILYGDRDKNAPVVARVENGHPAPAKTDLVPVYDIEASAGGGAVVDYEGVAYSLAFPPDYIRRVTRASPSNLTIISVKGDSMEPTLKDDDIVMLDMSKTSLGYEGLFVIRVYDVLHVKRLSHSGPGQVMVISDNRENYPPREYPMDEVEVVGKVIWKGGKV